MDQIFLEFLAEIVAVIIGIILAFQLDRWAGRSRDARKVAGYLERLKQDVVDDIKQIDRLTETTASRLQRANLLADSITDASVVDKDPDAYVNAVVGANGRTAFRSNQFTFQELQANGDVALLPEELRRALYNYYAEHNFTQQFDSFSENVQVHAMAAFAGVAEPFQHPTTGMYRSVQEEGRVPERYSSYDAAAIYERFMQAPQAQHAVHAIRSAQMTALGRAKYARRRAGELADLLDAKAE